ncbi:MAG: SMI1/KNR4 family protein [Limisphaerales bacterium]
MAAIDTLITLWPPPPTCIGRCTTETWNEVEKQIGVRPPPDYQQLLAAYGSGFVGLDQFDPYWLVVRSPLSEPGYGNLIDAFRTATALLSEQKAEFPQYVPFPILPTPGGLFPFAHDSCGYEYYWLTRGNPSEWPLIIDNGSGNYIELKMSFIDFVLSLVRGEPPHASFEKTKDDKMVWTPIDRLQ